jgi:hypothetical protein
MNAFFLVIRNFLSVSSIVYYGCEKVCLNAGYGSGSKRIDSSTVDKHFRTLLSNAQAVLSTARLASPSHS